MDNHCLPTRFLGAFYRWLLDRGFASEDILKNTRISDTKLTLSQAEVSLEQHICLILNAIDITKNLHLGFEFGRQLGINALGIAGHAARNCKTLKQAVTLVCQHLRSFSPMLMLSYNIIDKNAVLNLKDQESCSAIKIFRMECFISIAYHCLATLTQLHKLPVSAHVTYKKPDDWINFASCVPLSIIFNQPLDQITFPKSLLDMQLPYYEPVTLNALRNTLESCRNRQVQRPALTFRLEPLIINNLENRLSLPMIATKLGVSPRTLRRELKKQGTSFKAQIKQHKQQLAIRYLQSGNYSIEDIAAALGYQNTSSFARAFKKWTGFSPGYFRSNIS